MLNFFRQTKNVVINTKLAMMGLREEARHKNYVFVMFFYPTTLHFILNNDFFSSSSSDSICDGVYSEQELCSSSILE